MSTLRSAILAVIATATTITVTLSATPAHAATDEVSDQPAISTPMVNADGSVARVVYVDAARLTWGSRQAARRWDALVPGLEVRIAPCVAGFACVKVNAGSWEADSAEKASGGVSRFWAGLTVYVSASERLILLNRERVTIPSNRSRVAMHEMGHALGLGHHDGPRGIMMPSGGKLWESDPSPAEVAVLVAHYSSAPGEHKGGLVRLDDIHT